MKTAAVAKFHFVQSLIIFIFVLLLGIVFLFFAIKLNGQTIPENYVKTDATITRIEKELIPGRIPDENDPLDDSYEHRVFVAYSYNGTNYSDVEYPNYDSSMKEGDTVLLYLNPDDPAEFMADPSGSFVFVLIGIGVVLFGIGGIAVSIYKKKRGTV